MKYVVDTEFIDTPERSHLLSLAVVAEDGRHEYFEFDYEDAWLTPWLRENVAPHFTYLCPTSHFAAADRIARMIGDDVPEFWAYYGAYDWYWFCRVFGGFMQLPQHWGIVAYRDFAHIQVGVPDIAGAAHNALNDARSILAAMRLKGLVP